MAGGLFAAAFLPISAWMAALFAGASLAGTIAFVRSHRRTKVVLDREGVQHFVGGQMTDSATWNQVKGVEKVWVTGQIAIDAISLTSGRRMDITDLLRGSPTNEGLRTTVNANAKANE